MLLRVLFTITFFCFSELCNAQNFTMFPQFDDTPKVKAFAKQLTDSIPNDSLKVIAIHKWIINNIAYDTIQYEKERSAGNLVLQKWNINSWKDGFKDPSQVCSVILKNKKAICRGYAYLFVAFCRQIGVYAEPVVGFGKTGSQSTREESGHAWVIFQFKNKWYLCDPTWDAGMNADLEYAKELKSPFENQPEEFLKTHCSIDPIFQLVNSPKKIKTFFDETKIVSIENIDFNAQLNKEKSLKDDAKLLSRGNRIVEFNDNDEYGLAVLYYYRSVKLFQSFTSYMTKNNYINKSPNLEVMANRALPIKNEMLTIASEIKANVEKLMFLTTQSPQLMRTRSELVKSMNQFLQEESSLKAMYHQLEAYRKEHPIPKK